MSQLSVSLFSQAQRLSDILSHLLLFIVTLPLFYRVMLTINLVKIMVHFLLMAKGHVSIIDFLLCAVLSYLHILELDLASDQCAALTTSVITFKQIQYAARASALQPSLLH